MYVDYAFYSGTYGGAAVQEIDFPALARDASAYIDRITYGRLKAGAQVTDDVRMATCAVIDRMQVAKQSGALSVNAAIKEEINDGYRLMYNVLGDIRDELYADYLNAAYTYLIGTGLMDRSVGHDHQRRYYDL